MCSDKTIHSDIFTSDLDRQHEYVEGLKKHGDGNFALVATEAFVRGMRDSGYKSTATALNEFIDNSEQADATRVDIIAIEGESSGKKGAKKPISEIAIVDDGHGMEPDMMRASVRWGGTHRENDRSGLGRYGFGLPSAAVSMSEHYEVYSKTPKGQWHRIVIDLPAIATGKLTNDFGQVMAPGAEPCDLPDFVQKYLKAQKYVLESGTVVLVSKPDRLTTGFRRLSSFENKMLEQIGLTYRGPLRDISIYVNGKRAECVDPLFLTLGCRFYDIGTGTTAEELPPLTFEVTGESGKTGMVRMRFSRMHPSFQKVVDDVGKENMHTPRLSIMSANQSFFIVTRAGRQIDWVRQVPEKKSWGKKTLQNRDRNWAIELDFDPVLDELFGITVNKQQITMTSRMWEILEGQGLPRLIKDLSAWVNSSFEEYGKDVTKPEGDVQRDSEVIMEAAEKFRGKKRSAPTKKMQEGVKKVHEDAKKEAEASGRPVEDVVQEVLTEISKQPYLVDFESLPGAPFYRPESYGTQIRLWINRKHRFFADVYNAPHSTKRQKTALELLLLVLSSTEVNATGDREIFYERERHEWSKELSVVLDIFNEKEPIEEEKSDLEGTDEEGALASVTTGSSK